MANHCNKTDLDDHILYELSKTMFMTKSSTDVSFITEFGFRFCQDTKKICFGINSAAANSNTPVNQTE